MSADEFNSLAQIAQSITTVTVLTLWVYREIKRGDTAIQAILEEWKDLSRHRDRRIEEFAQSDD